MRTTVREMTQQGLHHSSCCLVEHRDFLSTKYLDYAIDRTVQVTRSMEAGAVGNSNERRVRDRRKKNGEPILYKREERSKEVTQFGAKPRGSSIGP